MGLTPRKIKKAAIVGGGLMGSGIATVFILNNFLVILKEGNEQLLSAGINRIKGKFPLLTSQTSIDIVFSVSQKLLFSSANLQTFVRKGQLTKSDYEKKLSLLSGVLDYEQFRDADVVIEVKFIFLPFSYLSIGLALVIKLCHQYLMPCWWLQIKI
jgi:enoyl-CoA hydratase/3-hydroxyacyl-CoA dehydrogenase